MVQYNALMRKRGINLALIFSIVFPAIVLLLIVMQSGLVSAFSLGINGTEKAKIGDTASFSASLDIEAFEKLPVNYFVFIIDGPAMIECKFYPNATPITGCDNFTITQTDAATLGDGNLSGNYSGTFYEWGNGTGYGSGILESLSYTLELNTSQLMPGFYETEFRAKLNQNSLSQQGKNLTLIEEIKISNETVDKTCVFENQGILASAIVTGSVKEVFLEINSLGNVTLIPVSNIGNLYYATTRVKAGNTAVRFAVKDIANDTTYGNLSNIFATRRTSLSVNPANPSGLNGWYVTEPEFALSNPDSSQIFYRWDSGISFNYTGPFRLENTPNNATLKGGIQELNFWSNTTCGIEPEQTRNFKLDFKNPEVRNMIPENRTTVYNNRKPAIQADLNDVYFANSGINETSILMKVNGNPVNFTIVSKSGQNVRIRYIPTENLSLGWNEIFISMSDKAGRQGNFSWGFNISTKEIFNMTVFMPQEKLYSSRKVQVNLSLTEKVDKVEYTILNEKAPKPKVLCSDCSEYGKSKKREITLNEGLNILKINASDEFGNSREQILSIRVDSRVAVITKTEPLRGTTTNGSNFLVKYTEENLKNVTLVYGNDSYKKRITKTDCESGSGKNCSFILNLEEFDGKRIDYYFELTDYIGTTKSREAEITADTISPILNIISPENRIYAGKVPFNITVSEKAKLEYKNGIGRWQALCTNCNSYGKKKVTKYFSPGNYTILIRATDKAGNSDAEEVSFKVL
jgi:hypothetical protein